MALKTKSIRGTRDVLPGDSAKWQYLEQIALETAKLYGISEIRVPTIEKTELFTRSVGETTDVVQKEMYTFEKGRDSITLRPEGTAGTVRAVLENNLLAGTLPVKLCYNVSCFRHENPQAGRLREFHQFGVECFGGKAATADAEVISVAKDILENLGIENISLNINSIGCPNCRPVYNKALTEYFAARIDNMCDSCKDRLERNPLRLLDCKEKACKEISKDAPIILNYLCDDCDTHFQALTSRLDALQIDYAINPYIVRGLDYYTKTVFEFVSEAIGAQGTVCGGGRYDLLVEQMGGAPTPALGFGMGLERLLMVMEAQGCDFPEVKPCDIYIGHMGETASIRALQLVDHLRHEGFVALCDTADRSVKAQMKYADKIGARYSCILGENELEEKQVVVKNMQSGERTTLALEPEALAKYLYDEAISGVMGAAENSLGSLLSGISGATHEEEKGE